MVFIAMMRPFPWAQVVPLGLSCLSTRRQCLPSFFSIFFIHFIFRFSCLSHSLFRLFFSRALLVAINVLRIVFFGFAPPPLPLRASLQVCVVSCVCSPFFCTVFFLSLPCFRCRFFSLVSFFGVFMLSPQFLLPRLVRRMHLRYTYIRLLISFHFLFSGVRLASVIIIYYLFLMLLLFFLLLLFLLLFLRYSSAPELLEPVVRSRTQFVR